MIFGHVKKLKIQNLYPFYGMSQMIYVQKETKYVCTNSRYTIYYFENPNLITIYIQATFMVFFLSE